MADLSQAAKIAALQAEIELLKAAEATTIVNSGEENASREMPLDKPPQGPSITPAKTSGKNTSSKPPSIKLNSTARKQLAIAMGLSTDEQNKSVVMQHRSMVTSYFRDHGINFRQKFKSYSYSEILFPLIRGCTKYMAQAGHNWTITTTENCVRQICRDNVRNDEAKKRKLEKEAKRKMQHRQSGTESLHDHTQKKLQLPREEGPIKFSLLPPTAADSPIGNIETASSSLSADSVIGQGVKIFPKNEDESSAGDSFYYLPGQSWAELYQALEESFESLDNIDPSSVFFQFRPSIVKTERDLSWRPFCGLEDMEMIRRTHRSIAIRLCPAEEFFSDDKQVDNDQGAVDFVLKSHKEQDVVGSSSPGSQLPVKGAIELKNDDAFIHDTSTSAALADRQPSPMGIVQSEPEAITPVVMTDVTDGGEKPPSITAIGTSSSSGCRGRGGRGGRGRRGGRGGCGGRGSRAGWGGQGDREGIPDDSSAVELQPEKLARRSTRTKIATPQKLAELATEKEKKDAMTIKKTKRNVAAKKQNFVI